MESDLLDDTLGWWHDAVYTLLIKCGVDEFTAIAETQNVCAEYQKNFGGRASYVPALDKDARHRQIAADLRAGMAPATAAEKHAVHRRTAEKIAAKTRETTNDPGLGTSDWVLK